MSSTTCCLPPVVHSALLLRLDFVLIIVRNGTWLGYTTIFSKRVRYVNQFLVGHSVGGRQGFMSGEHPSGERHHGHRPQGGRGHGPHVAGRSVRPCGFSSSFLTWLASRTDSSPALGCVWFGNSRDESQRHLLLPLVNVAGMIAAATVTVRRSRCPQGPASTPSPSRTMHLASSGRARHEAC